MTKPGLLVHIAKNINCSKMNTYTQSRLGKLCIKRSVLFKCWAFTNLQSAGMVYSLLVKLEMDCRCG